MTTTITLLKEEQVDIFDLAVRFTGLPYKPESRICDVTVPYRQGTSARTVKGFTTSKHSFYLLILEG